MTIKVLTISADSKTLGGGPARLDDATLIGAAIVAIIGGEGYPDDMVKAAAEVGKEALKSLGIEVVTMN